MTIGSSCRSYVRGKGKVVTKKRRQMENGGVKTKKTKKTNQRGVKTKKKNPMDGGSMRVGTGYLKVETAPGNPSRRSSASSRDSGLGASLPTSLRNSTNSLYSDLQHEIEPGANASPPKKSKLQYFLEEYDNELSINTFYEIIMYIIDHIDNYEFIDNADKKKIKRGKEILNELKNTNKNVEDVGSNETLMNFLNTLKLTLANNKNTEESSTLMERVISDLERFITIFDNTSLDKIAELFILLEKLEKLDIKQLPYNELKKKNQEEVEKKNQFERQLKDKYPRIRDPFLVVKNPGLPLVQKLLKFDGVLENIIKHLEDTNDNKEIIKKKKALLLERYKGFNETMRKLECEIDIPDVLYRGINKDIKTCFKTPNTQIMGQVLTGPGSICTILDKKRQKKYFSRGRETRKRFDDAYKKNCGIKGLQISSPIIKSTSPQSTSAESNTDDLRAQIRNARNKLRRVTRRSSSNA